MLVEDTARRNAAPSTTMDGQTNERASNRTNEGTKAPLATSFYFFLETNQSHCVTGLKTASRRGAAASVAATAEETSRNL